MLGKSLEECIPKKQHYQINLYIQLFPSGYIGCGSPGKAQYEPRLN